MFYYLFLYYQKHEKKILHIPEDKLYDEYLSTGIEEFELSEYKLCMN